MSKARGLADLGNVYNDGALSNRNLIINGAMQVAQRGTSVAGVTTSGYYAIDRVNLGCSSGISGTHTVSQSTDTPNGFSYSWKINCTTAQASPNQIRVNSRVEGYDVSHLDYNTATAKELTLSFWVKSNVAGTYAFSIETSATSRYFNTAYSIDVADTWEYKTISIVGDTGSALDTGNGIGLNLSWWLAAPEGLKIADGNSDTWVSNSSYVSIANGHGVNIASSTSNYFQITGVQLEVGDTATPFEHRSYGQELALCQRYFQELCPKTGTNEAVATGSFYSTTGFYAPVTLPVEMRADPTGTVFNQSSFKVFVAGAAITTSPVTLSTSSHRKAVEIEAVTAVNTAGRSGFLRTSGVPVPSIQLDAEL